MTDINRQRAFYRLGINGPQARAFDKYWQSLADTGPMAGAWSQRAYHVCRIEGMSQDDISDCVAAALADADTE